MTVAVTFFRPATLSFGTMFTQRTNFPELNDVVKPTKSINSAAKKKEVKKKIFSRHHKFSFLKLAVILENVIEATELRKATQKPHKPRVARAWRCFAGGHLGRFWRSRTAFNFRSRCKKQFHQFSKLSMLRLSRSRLGARAMNKRKCRQKTQILSDFRGNRFKYFLVCWM